MEDNYDIEIELHRAAAGLIRARKTLDALIEGGEDAVPSKANREALWKARQELYEQIDRIDVAATFLLVSFFVSVGAEGGVKGA